MPVRLFSVVGRKKPTAKDPEPDIFRMKIFAANEVSAKSRFWYFVPRLNKLKKMTGEILAVNEIFEKNSRVVKTYGIWLRYISRSGIHNMYKEFRDTTLTSAVQQLYAEMASRHRARNRSIQIIRTAVVPADKVRSSNLNQYQAADLKFPLTHVRPRTPRNSFAARRPNTFFG
mmetsp:Transcript_24835/g.36443  ORF Transcript_24835/g.36443 Transcript_24835/m.36443 type:complete len:173 (+) Transcript_24835:39-557(+)|eukprot:CAMPEP_0195523252 /NCGR_PEP_ID=MMETSP0794_2-20130614/22208_1 /TAXON_ID=515487 /ORGANISM="Stephanopyxis turris, Strain CCMP 815" /LENGTH=172 /DNA_ID=CAMNT_0040653199 /DNA_START=39 /DNA_END=557 /DNA_ORIENTATION=+